MKTITKTQTLLRCPACSQDIVASVEITPELSEPVLDDTFRPTVSVSAEVTRFTVNHRCPGAVPTVVDTTTEARTA